MHKWLYIVLFLYMIMPQFVHSRQIDEQKWEQLNQTTDQIWQYAKQKNFADAKQLLHYFSDQWLELTSKHPQLTITEMNIVSLSYDRAYEGVTNDELPIEDRLMRVAELRLVTDAMANDHHPLWLNTKNSILESIEHLQKYAGASEDEQFLRQFHQFLKQYQMIRPALLISLPEGALERLDALVNEVENRRANDGYTQVVAMMYGELEKIFAEEKQNEADASLLWVMFSIGSMIFVSLFYAGWKKYQGEKQKKVMRREMGEDE